MILASSWTQQAPRLALSRHLVTTAISRACLLLRPALTAPLPIFLELLSVTTAKQDGMPLPWARSRATCALAAATVPIPATAPANPATRAPLPRKREPLSVTAALAANFKQRLLKLHVKTAPLDASASKPSNLTASNVPRVISSTWWASTCTMPARQVRPNRWEAKATAANVLLEPVTRRLARGSVPVASEDHS